MSELPSNLLKPPAIVQGYRAQNSSPKIPEGVKRDQRQEVKNRDRDRYENIKLIRAKYKESLNDTVMSDQLINLSEGIVGTLFEQRPNIEVLFSHPKFQAFVNEKAAVLLKFESTNVNGDFKLTTPKLADKDAERLNIEFKQFMEANPELMELIPKLSSDKRLTLDIYTHRLRILKDFSVNSQREKGRLLKSSQVLMEPVELDIPIPSHDNTLNTLRQKYPTAQIAPKI